MYWISRLNSGMANLLDWFARSFPIWLVLGFKIVGVLYSLWVIRNQVHGLLTPKVHLFGFRELLRVCDQKLRIPVQRFEPDVIYCLDAYCAVWAEVLLDYLTRRPVIVVGDRAQGATLDDTAASNDAYDTVDVGNWSLFFPRNVFSGANFAQDKILVLSDCVTRGDMLTAAVEYLRSKGASSERITTLGLTVWGHAHQPAIVGVGGLSLDIVLPYTGRRNGLLRSTYEATGE